MDAPGIPVSRELSVFHVVGMWTSTSGSASVSCRHMWTRGGGKTITFLVDVVSGLPVSLDLSFVSKNLFHYRASFPLLDPHVLQFVSSNLFNLYWRGARWPEVCAVVSVLDCQS